MRAAVVQLGFKNDMNKEQTLQYALDMLNKCRGNDLIVLPELWSIGFASYDDYESLAESVEGRIASAISAKARELNAYIVSGSFIEKNGDKLLNTNIIFDRNGKNIGTYRKIHLLSYRSRESQFITSGNESVVAKTEFGGIGIATCYDLRFPEEFRRMTLEKGAKIFVVSAAWPFPRIESWSTFCAVRAMENSAVLIGANAVGKSRNIFMAGHSQIIDPWGYQLAGCGHDETIIQSEVRLTEIEKVRRTFPFY